jgi:hypothetical protein
LHQTAYHFHHDGRANIVATPQTREPGGVGAAASQHSPVASDSLISFRLRPFQSTSWPWGNRTRMRVTTGQFTLPYLRRLPLLRSRPAGKLHFAVITDQLSDCMTGDAVNPVANFYNKDFYCAGINRREIRLTQRQNERIET